MRPAILFLALLLLAAQKDPRAPGPEYFEAKVAEQQERHLKANDTAYNLEPNVKTGPGGLRDIQTIAWVAKRHFGASSLDELLTHGFLSPSELRKLEVPVRVSPFRILLHWDPPRWDFLAYVRQVREARSLIREYKIRRDPSCPVCGDSPTITKLVEYEESCAMTSPRR